MRVLPFVCLLVFSLALAACDSAAPSSPTPLAAGPYVGEWAGVDYTHILILSFDIPTGNRLVGEALLSRRRGPISFGAVRVPFWGTRAGEEVELTVPIALDWMLRFDGTLTSDSTLTGTLLGQLPPEVFSGDSGEPVDTEITFALDPVIVP